MAGSHLSSTSRQGSLTCCAPAPEVAASQERPLSCRQAGSGYFCQAPQQATYNFSTPGTSGSPNANANNNNNNNGRRLRQAAAAPAGSAAQCTHIDYYGPCGRVICSSALHAVHQARAPCTPP